MNSKKMKFIVGCTAVILIIAAIFAVSNVRNNKQKNHTLSDVSNLPDGHVAGGVSDTEWDEENMVANDNSNGTSDDNNSANGSSNSASNGTSVDNNSANGSSNSTSNDNSTDNNSANGSLNGSSNGTSNDNSNDNSSNDTPPNGELPAAGSMSYEEYMALDSKAQQAYYESFATPEAFFEWFNKAKSEYEAKDDSIEIDGNGSIDINDILNGK